jgi:diadenosine tetraphosphate (Ap4A) HIT family hydrolase
MKFFLIHLLSYNLNKMNCSHLIYGFSDQMKCEYCGIGGYGEKIVETQYWTIFLAPSQRYLGTCVVALNRPCRNLSELEDREWMDFSKVVKRMEFALDKTFKPTLYNWSCFKNAAFRGENPHPELHWHLIPRYKGAVEFQGIKFEDPDFGFIPHPKERKIPENVMKLIIRDITTNLEIK